MKNSVANHLVCVKDSCRSDLELECIRSKDDDCAEGFLCCQGCRAVYPVIEGVAVLVNDIVSYASDRPRVFGRWLVESKSARMKEFLKQCARQIKPLIKNRYEVGGAWFEPYLAMHSPRSKTDRHFARIIKQDFEDFYTNIVQVILRKFSSKQMCLDLGCATGTTTGKLAGKFGFVFGTDQSFSFIREARKLNNSENMEFLVANAPELPFTTNKFDLIVALNMIDLVEPKKLIECIHSLLSIKGSAVLTDPYDFRDESGNPRKLYDGRSIRRLLVNSGFTIDRSTSGESFWPWILRMYNRAYLVYFADLIIASKLAYSIHTKT